MPENLVMTSAYARTTVRTDSGSRGKKLSRVGKWVPDMYVAFRFDAKWTIFNRGNQRIWTSKNLDWSFLCPTHDNIFANKFLNLLRRAKSTPCLLGQNFDRLIHESKLVQHLKICLLTDLPTTGAYFSFQLTFKIIVFLSGSYRHKMEYKCCRVSISVFGFSSRKVFDGCLCDSSCGILQEKSF